MKSKILKKGLCAVLAAALTVPACTLDNTVQTSAADDGIIKVEFEDGKTDGGKIYNETWIGNTAEDGGPDKQGKHILCRLLLSLPQRFGNEGAAACAEHKSDGTENHEKRHNEVHGGKRGLAHEVGDKETIYYAVDGGKDHHNDRG